MREPEFNDRHAHLPRTSRSSLRHKWRSQLWRSTRRVPLPPGWSFSDFWLGLFGIFVVALMFARREGLYDTVEMLLSAVRHMHISDDLRILLGLSPTSPKPMAHGPGSVRDSRGHMTVPVEVAEKGFGIAGEVHIPLDQWDHLVPVEAVRGMSSVEVPVKTLSDVELATVSALERQGHIVPIDKGMLGFGKGPSAHIFIIPKTTEKCSFIFNCKLGNSAFEGPNPKMRLPNLYTLKNKMIGWAVEPLAT